MSRSSGEPCLFGRRDESRAAVEPTAALVAVLAVSAALGLYVAALEDATPERGRPTAEATLDRIEPVVTTGGVVDPRRMGDIDEFRFATTIAVEADEETWRVRSGSDAPTAETGRRSDEVIVAKRSVTVTVGPGQNVRGTLRAVVDR
jgi:hypothetical protein